MLRVQSSIFKKSVVLLHSLESWHIIVLNPAAERVQQENGILVTLSDKLLTSVLKQENMPIVKRVTNLESVNSISAALFSLSFDLRGSQTPLIKTIVEYNLLDELSFS